MNDLWPPPYRYGSVWIVLAAQIAFCTCAGASAGAAAVPSGNRTARVPGTSGLGCPSGTVLGSGGGGGGGGARAGRGGLGRPGGAGAGVGRRGRRGRRGRVGRAAGTRVGERAHRGDD